jgi:hypothetical protein
MADLATTYTLTTGGGTIIFNNGDLRDGTDKYWLQNIQGLDGPGLRTPIDNRPQTDGGLVHDFFKGPRHIVFEGILITESAGWPSFGDECITVQNEMEEDLIDALESIIRADGTLAWMPLGLAARSLAVRHDVTLEFTAIENYALKQFTFGLVAADPDWVLST